MTTEQQVPAQWKADLKEEVDRWFVFLRDRSDEGLFSPRENVMLGYAYGYAVAMVEAGAETLAREKLNWLMEQARSFDKHPAYLALISA
ncbi:hypothetical protein [Kitasatospora sp. NPDC058478]|uniref:hypothetical protein n=1 Tax=unclassified Kitasatospora TaxID=2633591 RepID=UPI0036659C21